MAEHEGSGPGRAIDAIPVVGQVVQKTSRFSREFVATMIALASSAFGVVAALAWNSAITTWFTSAFGTEASAPKVRSLFLYAVIATLVGVVVIVILGRLATRINAQPVEFKYPAPPKTQG
jgi:uncharacterized membrane protein YjjP (DUF1212 family)